ncbi:hypothetical protein DFQ27_006077 [Actinomortierella ambigua]|uniref:FAD-binding domain-containing protein n=1 Tax=Actinomortierella ambigua TaxID=1343610 RepID=A0A9P6PYT7_9FUNG|nr:hypothetical protein DFQ27_006077 [Actinomortierella ambigua]
MAPSADFHVLIVGAGIGGLLAAALLERANISYTVLERAKEVKALGSAIALSANILPVFEQLGIYEEFRSLSTSVLHGIVKDEAGKVVSDSDYTMLEERYGYGSYVCSRPALHELLLRQVPDHKVLFNKRVLSIQQMEDGVSVRAADNTTYQGHILVGADGAYSSVRQSLYKHMKDIGKLPKGDDEDLPFSTVCLVGTSGPMPPEMCVQSPGGDCRYECSITKDTPVLVAQFLLPDYTVPWMVNHYIGDTATRNEERFRNSEWGPEAVDQMINEVSHLKAPFGGTIGDYIKNTPSHLISKVLLEEKMFETWYHDRTVLLGDACHKMFPAAGQGAVNAMQDAVVLVNVLYNMPSDRPADILKAFKIYKEERYQYAKMSYESSIQFGELVKTGVRADAMRFMFRNMLPRFLWIKQLDTMLRHRPQVSFLPFVEPKGIAQPLPQPVYGRSPAPSIASSSSASLASSVKAV